MTSLSKKSGHPDGDQGLTFHPDAPVRVAMKGWALFGIVRSLGIYAGGAR